MKMFYSTGKSLATIAFKHIVKWLVGLALMAMLSAPSCAATTRVNAEPLCADFLAEKKLKPPQLEFVRCEAKEDTQVRELIATYRVRGKDAATVERALIKTTKMPRLRFMCCGWESIPPYQGIGKVPLYGTFDYGAEIVAHVSMHSGESVINRRARWAEIDWFTVTVMQPRQSP
jgi:Domian of unknown function (DUF4952)